MSDYRHRPGSFTQDPRGSNGLRGRTACDMREFNPWGALAATKQGGVGHWFFECSNGHEFLLNGATVRQRSKQGVAPVCPACEGEKK